MAIGFDPEPSRYDCPLLFQNGSDPIPPAIVAEKVPILPAFDAPGSPIQHAGAWSSLERPTHPH